MDQFDNTRHELQFLTVGAVRQMVAIENNVLDPYSLIISRDVQIGTGNTFYPNVIIERTGDAELSIGDNNTFYPGTYLLSSAGGLAIGNENEFGTGGCTIKANNPEAHIRIGDGGRYCDGANIMGNTTLESGTQVLGAITVQGCTLEQGGTYKEPDPDKRAAVLKGFGVARGLTLAAGEVVNGTGNFATSPVERQRAYHPK